MKKIILAILALYVLYLPFAAFSAPLSALKKTQAVQAQEKMEEPKNSINVDALDPGDLKQLSESTENTLDEKKKHVSNAVVEAQKALQEKNTIEDQIEQLKIQLGDTRKKITDTENKRSNDNIKFLKQQSKQLDKKYLLLKKQLKIKNEKAKTALENSSRQQEEIKQLKANLERLELEQTKRYSPRRKALFMGIYILATLIILYVKDKVVSLIEKRLIYRRENVYSVKILRVHTFLRILSWSISVLIIAITIFLILELFGFDSTTTLAGAGFLGIAVGFGAQQFVKDIFSGLFLVLEGQYGINDFISIGKFSGNVEDINLRFTKLRNYDGNVVYVPNSDIHTVINHGKEYANAVIHFYIDVRQDVEPVFTLVREVVSELKEFPDMVDEILGKVELLGINAFTPTGVEIKFRVKTAPQSQWLVAREIRLALKKQFELQDIQLYQYQFEKDSEQVQ